MFQRIGHKLINYHPKRHCRVHSQKSLFEIKLYLDIIFPGSVAKIILLPFQAITNAFCIIIDLFRIYKYPICDVFHWFCKIARFFATEPIRMMKLQQKISGTFRSIQGAVAFCRIRGYISTIRKNDLNAMDAILAALNQAPLLF